jgi:predicted AAA+ superfamily ATPase
MGIWIERDLYLELLYWKNRRIKQSLILGGCRQSGKTSLLKHFGKTDFENSVHVDLSDTDLRLELETSMKKYYREGTMEEDDGEFIVKAFFEVSREFTDSTSTLLILDEVQESLYVHNKIRHFTRGLKSYCVFTGSYMAETNLGKGFREAAGDTYFLTLYPISFKEFLTASKVLGKFEKIDVFKKKFEERESEVLRNIEKLYKDYLELGGYPLVLANYLEGTSVSECKDLLPGLVHNIYGELEKRFESGMTYELWDYVSKAVARALIFNKEFYGDLEEIYSIMPNEAFTPNVNQIWMALTWMRGCNVVNGVPISTKKPFGEVTSLKKFFFTDIGIFQEIVASGMIDIGSVTGHITEQFVFLNLLVIKDLFMHGIIETYHKVGDKFEEEVDFTVMTKTRKILLIEVKATGGPTKSSNRLLETRKADYMVKFEDHTGIIQKDRAVLPVWGVIHLKKIVELLDSEVIGINATDEKFNEFIQL